MGSMDVGWRVRTCTTGTTIWLFFFNDPATTEIYTLSLHDALPISSTHFDTTPWAVVSPLTGLTRTMIRSEEHTSELQSRFDLVCRLLLDKNCISSGGRHPVAPIARGVCERWSRSES